MNHADDPILRRLKELPDPPFDARIAARLRRQAVAALETERRLKEMPWLIPLHRAFHQLVLPTLVTATVGTYLLIAIRTASALYP